MLSHGCQGSGRAPRPRSARYSSGSTAISTAACRASSSTWSSSRPSTPTCSGCGPRSRGRRTPSSPSQFYDLIMEAGRFEKDSLFGQSALGSEDMRRTLTELFERLVQAEARQVKTELESHADYRE